jgi:hypothetical protein
MRYYLDASLEGLRRSSVGIADDPAEIRNEHLRKRSPGNQLLHPSLG